MFDSSGISLILSPHVRQYDAGGLSIGISTKNTHFIPPYQKNFLSTAFCHSSCTDKVCIMWIDVCLFVCLFVCLLVCLFVNATFNNISVISSRSVFIGGGNRGKPPTCRKSWQPLSHNVAHLALIEIRTHSISGDSKSNYHTITARTAPNVNRKFKEYWLTIILILTKWLTISHLNITEHKKDQVK